MQLAHLSFADDILVFTDGSVRSLRGFLEVMNQFASISGLHINASKSTIFAASQTIDPLIHEVERIGIKVGTLPVKYLGMPFTTKALTKQDYETLIDRVRKRMLFWRNKFFLCWSFTINQVCYL